jgi:hypothetical protein
LSTIPQLDPAKQNIGDGLNGFFRSAAKAALICDPETSSHINQLVIHYGEVLLRTIPKVQPIHQKQSEIAISDSFYQKDVVEADRIIAAMRSMNESGKPDMAAFAALESSLHFHQAQIEKRANEIAAAWNSRNALHRLFVRELLSNMKPIIAGGVPVVVALRRELGLGGDIAEFEKQLEANLQRIEKGLDAALATIKDDD